MILKKEHSPDASGPNLSGFSSKHCPRSRFSGTNIEDSKQLVKASGSVGGNYREANESLSKKDFLMRIKISRKEAKERAYWLRLIHETNNLRNANDAQILIQEANELKKIFSSMVKKSK